METPVSRVSLQLCNTFSRLLLRCIVSRTTSMTCRNLVTTDGSDSSVLTDSEDEAPKDEASNEDSNDNISAESGKADATRKDTGIYL